MWQCGSSLSVGSSRRLGLGGLFLSFSGVWPERLAALPVAYSGQTGLDCGCAAAFLGGWPAVGTDPVSVFVCRWMSVEGASGVVVVLRREYRAPLGGQTT